MEEFPLRPVLSGIAGGLIAWWLTAKWKRWVPTQVGTKDKSTLVAENRWRVLVANSMFFGVLIIGILVFSSGKVEPTNWAAGGLVFGMAFVSPVAFLYISTVHLGPQRVQEVFVAFAINQRTPMIVLYGLVALAFVALCVSVVALADA
jgi:hypothetical protein